MLTAAQLEKLQNLANNPGFINSFPIKDIVCGSEYTYDDRNSGELARNDEGFTYYTEVNLFIILFLFAAHGEL